MSKFIWIKCRCDQMSRDQISCPRRVCVESVEIKCHCEFVITRTKCHVTKYHVIKRHLDEMSPESNVMGQMLLGSNVIWVKYCVKKWSVINGV